MTKENLSFGKQAKHHKAVALSEKIQASGVYSRNVFSSNSPANQLILNPWYCALSTTGRTARCRPVVP